MAESARVRPFELLNGWPSEAARDALTRCCGSRRWVERMLAARPFASEQELLARADSIWQALEPDDYLEAFAHHPRIGADVSTQVPGSAGAWSSAEQSGVQRADSELLARLRRGNELYDERFGFAFIICATGKGGADMLTALEQRLSNTPDTELRLAAIEQAKITRLRLGKLEP